MAEKQVPSDQMACDDEREEVWVQGYSEVQGEPCPDCDTPMQDMGWYWYCMECDMHFDYNEYNEDWD